LVAGFVNGLDAVAVDGIESRDADPTAAESARKQRSARTERRLNRVAEAFALVIDAKSPYTFRHSERVAEIAVAVARRLDYEPLAVRDIRRAALLHDIGKLGVSNLILDKAGPLDGGH